MNTTIELPSGKILNIARFIALLPNQKVDESYDLILEGYPHPITLEKKDVEILMRRFQFDLDSERRENQEFPTSCNESGWDREEQLQKNLTALELLKKRRERYQNMSEDESKLRAEFFENFKKTVDSERLPGQKLYSET
ncbi:hypothetical protein [Scytonema sp. NUACC26]|uniref:hypothetical protein n=1 Tax=Scytonema sp. NUACC26 TaxID=3140176 RepID=UPI0034DC17EE